MTDDFEKRLVEIAKNVLEYRRTTDCKDITFLSKLDYLLGYIMALEEREETTLPKPKERKKIDPVRFTKRAKELRKIWKEERGGDV